MYSVLVCADLRLSRRSFTYVPRWCLGLRVRGCTEYSQRASGKITILCKPVPHMGCRTQRCQPCSTTNKLARCQSIRVLFCIVMGIYFPNLPGRHYAMAGDQHSAWDSNLRVVIGCDPWGHYPRASFNVIDTRSTGTEFRCPRALSPTRFPIRCRMCIPHVLTVAKYSFRTHYSV